MSLHWSFIPLVISIIFLQISFLCATPIHSELTNQIIDDNIDGFQHAHNGYIYAMKNIVNEPNTYERMKLLNQLRESLNRLCLAGYFGPSHAEACRHVVDVVHQSYVNNDDETRESSNEAHGIQKRFFCNGFIGCKSASG
ncbi:unnamed protein product [Adineta ricciae]|uniref:Uncharacterized protein n=1 Tax=Adineta ricciae TaxID=249248 RepID=A0A813S8T8_ADIRI|nr:unnamed protein product [Adineta ricciae]